MSADLSLPHPAIELTRGTRPRVTLGLMLASGFAGLGYQIVWTQQSAMWLGHEAAAVLAVITAFFGGLAIGCFTLAPRIERSTRPARWYAACEATIAVWGIALALLLAPISTWMLALTGPQPAPLWQWSVSFVGTLIVLLPATAAMGATLPAMERVTASLCGRRRQHIGALYAANTFGAVLGVLATAFWLVPTLGLVRTAVVCAACNIACAVAAWKLRKADTTSSSEPAPASPPPAAPVPFGERGALWVLAATGLLGIGYEVLVVRVLSQVAEDTVYTFAILLAVYLVGSALGAATYQRWLSARPQPAPMQSRLLCLQAATCLAGSLGLWSADRVKLVALAALGPSMPAALASEAVLALVAFALPTIVMGALFSHLCVRARTAGQGFGRALGFNTLGAAAAPLLFGVLLVPALGAKLSLLLVAASYLALAASATVPVIASVTTATAISVVALWAPPLAFVDLPPGGRIVSYDEGPMAAVSVVEDAEGVARLRINNRQQEGSSATVLTDARQALLPLLLHPAPRHALFLGLGTGVTASAAAQDAALQVDAVELLPEVIAASSHFAHAFGDGAASPHVVAADARRFVKTTSQRYELIVADNFHPARSGSGALYTVEHFRAVRERLADDGVFCQWLPLHQLDLATVRSIVKSFIAVNPNAWAMLATNSLETPVVGLVARRDGQPLHMREIQSRLSQDHLPLHLADFGLADEFAVLGSFIAGPPALARLAADAPLNTDDHPVVSYRAPRITYAPDSRPRDRLHALLVAVDIEPSQVLDVTADSADARRLAAYWIARNRFIDIGQQVRPSPDVRDMLAQVREPLLAVLRTSPDFRPAYDPLLRMAASLERGHPAKARALYTALRDAQPARPEALRALQRFDRPTAP